MLAGTRAARGRARRRRRTSFRCRGGHRARGPDGAAGTAGTRITTSRAAILDVLDAKIGLEEAVEAGTRDRARVAGRCAACARHAAARTSTPRSGHLRSPDCCRTPGGTIMSEAITDARLVQAAPHGGGAWCRHRGPDRRARTRGARFRRHGVRVLVRTNATGWAVPPGTYPPVKLGGLAASQYSTVGTHDGSPAELRPFPGRRGSATCHPGRAVAGEHGFRFFPAYYLHIWDLFQRIPVYQRTETGGGRPRWKPTSRTVMDNVGGWSPRAPRWTASRPSSFPANSP